MSGTQVWVEIPSKDPHKLHEFYKAAFPTWGWRFHSLGQENNEKKDDEKTVIHITFGNEQFNGGIVQMPPDCNPGEQALGRGSTCYYEIESIDEVIPRLEKLGAKVVFPKTNDGNGLFANLVDPEGNRFGIHQLFK